MDGGLPPHQGHFFSLVFLACFHRGSKSRQQNLQGAEVNIKYAAPSSMKDRVGAAQSSGTVES